MKISRVIKKPAQWSVEDKKELVLYCGKGLLKQGRISKEIVDRELKGSFILEKFSFPSIRTRINYERQ